MKKSGLVIVKTLGGVLGAGIGTLAGFFMKRRHKRILIYRGV